MSKEARTSTRPNERTTRSRLIATGMGVLALLAAAGMASRGEATPVPCDPVIDNNCVPGGPESTLPTLPEKGEDTTTTTAEVTTTTAPSTTTTFEVTTTTMNVPPTTEYVPPVVTTAPVVPPAQPQAPHTL